MAYLPAGSTTYFAYAPRGNASWASVAASSPQLMLWAKTYPQVTALSYLPSPVNYTSSSIASLLLPSVVQITNLSSSLPLVMVAVGAPATPSGAPSGAPLVFSIAATSGGGHSGSEATQLLQGGPPLLQQLHFNTSFTYRVVVLDVTRDLVITVSPLFGTVTILVSPNATAPSCALVGQAVYPLCSNYMWASTSNVLRVASDDPCTQPPATPWCSPVNFQPGIFLVGVFASTSALLTVNVQGPGAIMLTSGLAQTGSATNAQPAYFLVQVVWRRAVCLCRALAYVSSSSEPTAFSYSPPFALSSSRR